MALTLIATPGAPDANSYLTEEEADAYFESRIPLDPPWDEVEDKARLLVMATRLLDATFQPMKIFVPFKPGQGTASGYYRTRPQWTGYPATKTQRLAWPRRKMYDRNGNEIPDNVIPEELKEAVAEFAGQLAMRDRSLDNDVVVQGITSIRAGSVSLSFKDGVLPQVIPDAVRNLLVESWLTDELIEPAQQAEFGVL